jgi:hypothetical protein
MVTVWGALKACLRGSVLALFAHTRHQYLMPESPHASWPWAETTAQEGNAIANAVQVQVPGLSLTAWRRKGS